jgi:hypothetical protein
MPTVPAVRHTDGSEVDFREAMVLDRARAAQLRQQADSLEAFLDGVEVFVEGRRLSRAAEIDRLRTALAGMALWLAWARDDDVTLEQELGTISCRSA